MKKGGGPSLQDFTLSPSICRNSSFTFLSSIYDHFAKVLSTPLTSIPSPRMTYSFPPRFLPISCLAIFFSRMTSAIALPSKNVVFSGVFQTILRLRTNHAKLCKI
jgi:hypothetical protein